MRENITKIPFEFFVCGYFARCLDNEKRSRKKYARKETLPGLARKSSRFKHRTFTIPRSIRYLSRYPPPFSTRLLSFSRFPPCQCFHFLALLAQHARSTERVLPVRKYGNRAEKRARLPRIVLIRPRLQQFPNFRIVSNFLANFPLAKNSSRFLRRKIWGREKRPRRGKSFESRVDFDPRVVVSFVFDYVVLVAWRKHLVRSVSSFFLTRTLRYISISISSNIIRIFDMDFEYSMEI